MILERIILALKALKKVIVTSGGFSGVPPFFIIENGARKNI